jgi:light-independent protochlorophyllide reductase subunit B
MFRDDVEFHDAAGASHLGAKVAPPTLPRESIAEPTADVAVETAAETPAEIVVAERPAAWEAAAEQELRKIPFFVRGKARRNTERFAAERGLTTITVDTLYDAKAHFGR